jgi:MFS family permease
VAPQHRGLAFSFHRAMDHSGAVLGPLVALGLLQLILGYAFWRTHSGVSAAEMEALRLVFAAALVPGLLAVAVIVFMVREVAPKPQPVSERADGENLPRRFFMFVGASALFALGNSSDLFLLLYAHERFGYGLFGLILLWVGLHVIKVVSSVPGGLLSDRVGRRPAILAGWTVYALVYLGLAFAGQAWQLWALLGLYGIYFGLTEGAAKAMIADYTRPHQRGRAFGIFHAAVGMAALPASLLFGVFWAALGATTAFSIGAGLAVAAAIVLIASGPPPARVE